MPRPLATICALCLMCFTADAQLLIAHRGASHDAPENTIAAFRLAWEQGADGIEGDFRLTADGKIVCIHDADTRRVAGTKLNVAGSTLADLKKIDVGIRKHVKYRGETIPTLEDVLAAMPAGKLLFLEIKSGPEIIPPLAQILRGSKIASDRIVIICFKTDVLTAVKRALPAYRTHWLVSVSNDKPDASSLAATVQRMHANGFGAKANLQTFGETYIKRLRGIGIQEYHVWTVNDPKIAFAYMKWGAYSITTDRPKAMREGLLRLRSDKITATDDVQGGVPRARNILAWLPLDDSLNDSSRHRVKTTWQGDEASLRFTKGVFGNALNLDGKKGAVSIPLSPPREGSICLWYRTEAWYDYQTLFDNARNENAWEMWIYKNGQLRVRMDPKHEGLRHDFHQTGDAEEWHHIVFTWDAEDDSRQALRLYINGHLADASSWSAQGGSQKFEAAGSHVHVGGGHRGNKKGNGRWDDFAILDAPLNEFEVKYLMKHGVQAFLREK
jgi:glycerophosphoryl diester phosphodiesterase